MRRLLPVVLCSLVLAPAAAAATTVTAPVFDSKGRLVQTPFAPSPNAAHLTKKRALALFSHDPKVADWLARYPVAGRVDDETYDAKASSWTVKIWWGDAGEIAQGTVVDATGEVTEAWTGPQVAWGMARGSKGAFGGPKINSPWIWGAFCLVFLVGLADFRRPLSLRNLARIPPPELHAPARGGAVVLLLVDDSLRGIPSEPVGHLGVAAEDRQRLRARESLRARHPRRRSGLRGRGGGAADDAGGRRRRGGESRRRKDERADDNGEETARHRAQG